MQLDLAEFSQHAVQCGVLLVSTWASSGCPAYSLRDIAASATLTVDLSPLQDREVADRLSELQALRKGFAASCDGAAEVALDVCRFLDYVGAPECLTVVAGAVAVGLSELTAVWDMAALSLPASVGRQLLCLRPEWLWAYCGLIRREEALRGWNACLERRGKAKQEAHAQTHRSALARERFSHVHRPAASASRLKRVTSRPGRASARASSKPETQIGQTCSSGDTARAAASTASEVTQEGDSQAPAGVAADLAAFEALGARGGRAWSLDAGQHASRALGARYGQSAQGGATNGNLTDGLSYCDSNDGIGGWVWSWAAFASRVEASEAMWDACLFVSVLSQQLRNAADGVLRTYGPRILRDLSRLPGGLDAWYAAVDPVMAAAAQHDWAVVAKRTRDAQQRQSDADRIRLLAALPGSVGSSGTEACARTGKSGAPAAVAAATATAAAVCASKCNGHTGCAGPDWPHGGVAPSIIATAVNVTFPSAPAMTREAPGAEDASATVAGGEAPLVASTTPAGGTSAQAHDMPAIEPFRELFTAFRRWGLQFAAAEMSVRDHGPPPLRPPVPPMPYTGETISTILTRLTRQGPSHKPVEPPLTVETATFSSLRLQRNGSSNLPQAQADALTGARTAIAGAQLAKSTHPKSIRAGRQQPGQGVKAAVSWSSSVRTPGGLPGLSIAAATIQAAPRGPSGADLAAQARAKAAARTAVAAEQRLRTRRAAAARTEAAAQRNAFEAAHRALAKAQQQHRAASVIQSAARSWTARRFASLWRRSALHSHTPSLLCSDDGLGLCVVPALFGVPRVAFAGLVLGTARAVFGSSEVLNLRGLGGGEGGVIQNDVVEEVDFGDSAVSVGDQAQWVGDAWAEQLAGTVLVAAGAESGDAARETAPVVGLGAAIRLYVAPMHSLTALDLTASCTCTDDDFASLALLPKLASLEVGGWRDLTSVGVRRFVAACRNTTILPRVPPLLTSRDAAHGTPARLVVGQVAIRAPPLRSLALSDCRRIDDDALFAIGKGVPGVRDLCLFGCSRVTDRGAASFSGSRARLERLCVAGAYKFGSDAMRFLLSSVNPRLHTYISPAEFRRYPFDAGPDAAEAFPDGESGRDEDWSLEDLTPSRLVAVSSRKERR